MQYTETELNKLIETVEKEFSAVLTKAEDAHKATLAKSEGANSAAPLAKAEDKPEKKDAPPEKKDAAPAKEGEDKAADQKDAAPAAPKEGEAAAPQAKEGEAPAAAAPAEGQAAPAEGDAHGYDPEDMEHMQKMYASMSKGELKAHHDCIAALAKGSMAKCGEMAPGKNPAEMGKSEPKSHEEANGGQIAAGGEPKGSPGAQSPASKEQGNLSDMEKSEKEAFDLAKTENEALKAEVANLKKTQETVQEFLTKLVKKVPQGKAITEVAALTKSEGAEQTQELSKAEVNAKLLQKSSDPKLSKNDREAINAFYLNKADINTISHLLKN